MYEIIDHGCDGAQYFPGCGVSFTKFTHVVTGIGDSAREAGEDALEQYYLSADRTLLKVEEAKLEKEIAELSPTASFKREDVNDEWHHYVSIRWKE